MGRRSSPAGTCRSRCPEEAKITPFKSGVPAAPGCPCVQGSLCVGLLKKWVFSFMGAAPPEAAKSRNLGPHPSKSGSSEYCADNQPHLWPEDT